MRVRRVQVIRSTIGSRRPPATFDPAEVIADTTWPVRSTIESKREKSDRNRSGFHEVMRRSTENRSRGRSSR